MRISVVIAAVSLLLFVACANNPQSITQPAATPSGKGEMKLISSAFQ